jgi:hypothetical protein
MHEQHTAGRHSLIRIALLLFVAIPVLAQQPPGPPPIDRANTERARQQEMSNREWQLRNFGNSPATPTDKRQLKALMAQTEEDFNRILTLHNEIARAISSNKAFDYHFISEATGEIRKRASRLQSTLALRPPSTEAQVIKQPEEFNDSQIKDALIKLCKQIRSFVTNPVIETPNTVDAQQLERARRDLEGVVQLSGQIKKDTNKLSKPHE